MSELKKRPEINYMSTSKETSREDLFVCLECSNSVLKVLALDYVSVVQGNILTCPWCFSMNLKESDELL